MTREHGDSVLAVVTLQASEEVMHHARRHARTTEDAKLDGARALSVRSLRRALVGALLAGAVGVAVLSNPAEARLVFVQGHNVVALVLWIYLYRRQRRSLAVPLV